MLLRIQIHDRIFRQSPLILSSLRLSLLFRFRLQAVLQFFFSFFLGLVISSWPRVASSKLTAQNSLLVVYQILLFLPSNSTNTQCHLIHCSSTLSSTRLSQIFL